MDYNEKFINISREINGEEINIFIDKNFIDIIGDFDFLLKVTFQIKNPLENGFCGEEESKNHSIFENHIHKKFYKKHNLFSSISLQKPFKERILYIFGKNLSDFEKKLNEFILENNYDLKFEIIENKVELEKNYKELYPGESEIIYSDNNDIIERIIFNKLGDKINQASDEEIGEIVFGTRHFIHYFYSDTKEKAEKLKEALIGSYFEGFKKEFEGEEYNVEITFFDKNNDDDIEESFYSINISYYYNFSYINDFTMFFKDLAEELGVTYDFWECSN